jgi:hypothetical protein
MWRKPVINHYTSPTRIEWVKNKRFLSCHLADRMMTAAMSAAFYKFMKE